MKIFKYINFILLIINAVLLFPCFNSGATYNVLEYLFTLIIYFSLIVIFFINIIKKKKISNDKTYIILFFIVQIITLIIYLRAFFDPSIVSRTVDYNISGVIAKGLYTDFTILFILQNLI